MGLCSFPGRLGSDSNSIVALISLFKLSNGSPVLWLGAEASESFKWKSDVVRFGLRVGLFL